MVLRLIPLDIYSIDELGLPPIVRDLTKHRQGLILVTGPTGCGKSTTLAAMIDNINLSKNCNIVTIEDPIEFVHPDKQAIVNQREVGIDTESFSDALKYIVRQSPDAVSYTHLLRIIASNDQRLVEEIRAERDRIEAMKEELEQKKNRLEGMRRQTLAHQEEVSRVVSTRETVLKELQQEIARNLKAIKDLEQESQRLENIIRDLMRGSGGSGVSGKLCYPIEPTTWVSSGFGWRRDPFTGATSWHGGVDIATYGRANYILAAESGRVVLARWNGGYGNCIIIDHGGGTATLYAHLSSISVGAGQTVSRGQRIGRAGTTGNSTGVHLHFEVREYNKPPYRYYPSGAPDHRYNPMSYL